VPANVILFNILSALLVFNKTVLFPINVPFEIEPPSIDKIQLLGIFIL